MREREKIILEYLKEQGYHAKVDKDGDIVFKCESMNLAILVDDNDEDFFRLILPNFWEIESEGELDHVLLASSEINHEIKLIKITTSDMETHASVEMLLTSAQDIAKIFEKSLRCIQHATYKFAEKMREVANRKRRIPKQDADSSWYN